MSVCMYTHTLKKKELTTTFFKYTEQQAGKASYLK